MKKKVTNIYKEPISLPLQRLRGICRHPQRAYEMLGVGESRVCDESEVSSEIEKIIKRGKLKIEDVIEAPEPRIELSLEEELEELEMEYLGESNPLDDIDE